MLSKAVGLSPVLVAAVMKEASTPVNRLCGMVPRNIVLWGEKIQFYFNPSKLFWLD